MKRTEMKRRYRRNTGPDKATRQTVTERSGGRCEFTDCWHVAEQVHHRKPRRAGGTRDPRINLPSNLVDICLGHHDWAEHNRTDAEALGLLLSDRADPAHVPVKLRGRRVLLSADGRYLDAPEEAA